VSFYSLRQLDFPNYVIQDVSKVGENILDASSMDQTKKMLHTHTCPTTLGFFVMITL